MNVRTSVIQQSTAGEEGATLRAYLLKFDWALEEWRGARYPYQREMDGDVEWAADVESRSLSLIPIQKTHDEYYMRARLRDLFHAKECTGSVVPNRRVNEDTDGDMNEDHRPSERPKLSPIDTGMDIDEV